MKCELQSFPIISVTKWRRRAQLEWRLVGLFPKLRKLPPLESISCDFPHQNSVSYAYFYQFSLVGEPAARASAHTMHTDSPAWWVTAYGRRGAGGNGSRALAAEPMGPTRRPS